MHYNKLEDERFNQLEELLFAAMQPQAVKWNKKHSKQDISHPSPSSQECKDIARINYSQEWDKYTKSTMCVPL